LTRVDFASSSPIADCWARATASARTSANPHIAPIRIDRIVVPFYCYPTNEAARLPTLRLEVISSRVKKQERTDFVVKSLAGRL
jgi:hypothetical protein